MGTKKETLTEEQKKERNKTFLGFLLVGIIIFEVIRSYVGTVLTLLIYVSIGLMVFKRKSPEKFDKYFGFILKKKESPKDLNKNNTKDNVEEYYN